MPNTPHPPNKKKHKRKKNTQSTDVVMIWDNFREWMGWKGWICKKREYLRRSFLQVIPWLHYHVNSGKRSWFNTAVGWIHMESMRPSMNSELKKLLESGFHFVLKMTSVKDPGTILHRWPEVVQTGRIYFAFNLAWMCFFVTPLLLPRWKVHDL